MIHHVGCLCHRAAAAGVQDARHQTAEKPAEASLPDCHCVSVSCMQYLGVGTQGEERALLYSVLHWHALAKPWGSTTIAITVATAMQAYLLSNVLVMHDSTFKYQTSSYA